MPSSERVCRRKRRFSYSELALTNPVAGDVLAAPIGTSRAARTGAVMSTLGLRHDVDLASDTGHSPLWSSDHPAYWPAERSRDDRQRTDRRPEERRPEPRRAR